jgi:hypothetical protein
MQLFGGFRDGAELSYGDGVAQLLDRHEITSSRPL